MLYDSPGVYDAILLYNQIGVGGTTEAAIADSAASGSTSSAMSNGSISSATSSGEIE